MCMGVFKSACRSEADDVAKTARRAARMVPRASSPRCAMTKAALWRLWANGRECPALGAIASSFRGCGGGHPASVGASSERVRVWVYVGAIGSIEELLGAR